MVDKDMVFYLNGFFEEDLFFGVGWRRVFFGNSFGRNAGKSYLVDSESNIRASGFVIDWESLIIKCGERIFGIVFY